MDWFARHIDTVVVLGGILGVMLWMNGRFSDVEKDITNLEKRLIKIEAVLILRGIMPAEMSAVGEEK